jgi:hypothetical protein
MRGAGEMFGFIGAPGKRFGRPGGVGAQGLYLVHDLWLRRRRAGGGNWCWLCRGITKLDRALRQRRIVSTAATPAKSKREDQCRNRQQFG